MVNAATDLTAAEQPSGGTLGSCGLRKARNGSRYQNNQKDNGSAEGELHKRDRKGIVAQSTDSGNDNCIPWLQQNVLLHVLPFDDLFVVEFEPLLTAVFLTHDYHVRRLGIFQDVASERDNL